MTDPASEHWDDVYATNGRVSWYQARSATSLRLLEAVGDSAGSVIDIGAGASTLVDELLARGWSDITVLDVSNAALDLVRARLASRALAATAVACDVLDWEPERTYDVWHDRAVLHFLTPPQVRARYVETAARAVRPGGHLVIGAFAEDGPTRCSGLVTSRYSAEQLASLFSGGFEPVHAEREEHHTRRHSAVLHLGSAAAPIGRCARVNGCCAPPSRALSGRVAPGPVSGARLRHGHLARRCGRRPHPPEHGPEHQRHAFRSSRRPR